MTVLSSKQRAFSRPYRDDEDFWRVRRLLIETYPITPTGFNWEIRRWDGFRFHHSNPDPDPRWKELVHLWETEDGTLVGVAHPEGTGDAHFELHPDFRHIEEDMLRWAEKNLAALTEDGHARMLRTFVCDYDVYRHHLMEKFGYEKTNSGEVIRRLRFGDKTIPQTEMPAGYIMRTTNPDDIEDCRRIADLLNAAFNRDFHTAAELHVFFSHAPCYRSDLDLVAELPDGSFAAYVGVPYIEENGYGVFEPVCTHPDHLRMGLARWLMLEGLRRLKALGALDVYVGTGDQVAANKLYNAVGFTEAYRMSMWRKVM